MTVNLNRPAVQPGPLKEADFHPSPLKRLIDWFMSLDGYSVATWFGLLILAAMLGAHFGS